MTDSIPLNAESDDQSNQSNHVRGVIDKISKLGDSVSAGINYGNIRRGYDVVDQIPESASDDEYSFPQSPKFVDYSLHPVRFLPRLVT